MRQRSPTTHPMCRSLLQKAVRRGDVELTRRLTEHLFTAGDRAWLRQRVAVIVCEECWPLGAELNTLTRDFASVSAVLERVAAYPKYKDAAGLGAMAYALAEGETTVCSDPAFDAQIRIIKQAIERPEAFWDWVAVQAHSSDQQQLVEAARRGHRRGGWPWDRAFMQAAAYLAVIDGLPERQALPTVPLACPVWVGIDKHTPAGKIALRQAATQLRIPPRQLAWASFYFESARVNADLSGVWFRHETAWRLRQVGLTYDAASELWQRAWPRVYELLTSEAATLTAHLATDTVLSKVQQNLDPCLPQVAFARSAQSVPDPESSERLAPEEQPDRNNYAAQSLHAPLEQLAFEGFS